MNVAPENAPDNFQQHQKLFNSLMKSCTSGQKGLEEIRHEVKTVADTGFFKSPQGKCFLSKLFEQKALTTLSVEFSELLKLLTEHGAYINARDNVGMTPLMYAARYGHLTPELLFLFQRLGADVEARDDDGCTALIIAAKSPSNITYFPSLTPSLLEAFVRSGADINIRDYDHNTPLMTAAWHGNITPELIQSFLSLGADISITDNYGHTAMSLCFMAPEFAKGMKAILSFAVVLYPHMDKTLTSKMAQKIFLDGGKSISFFLSYLNKDFPFVENLLEVLTGDIFKKNGLTIEISGQTAEVIVFLLNRQFETNPGLVVRFVKNILRGQLEKWVDEGVKGAEELVYKLVSHVKKRKNTKKGCDESVIMEF